MQIFKNALLGCLLVAASSTRAEFFVAPDGNDSNGGTRSQPFLTLQRAVEATRALPSGADRRIVVRGGDYYDAQVELGAEDSGLVIEAAEGERPTLLGGGLVRGWEADGTNFFSAPWSADRPDVRLLVVDGKLAHRSRYPATGRLKHENTFSVRWMSSTGGGWQRKPTPEELGTLRYREGDLPEGLDVASAEITIYHMWDESCVGIKAQDPNNHTLTLSPRASHPPGAFGVKDYVLWNLPQGMTGPGSWYHDRSRHRIVYWPSAGQDMSKVTVLAPTRTSILHLRGRAEKKIRDVIIRGLGIELTTVPLMAAGFGAAGFDGALSLEHAETCSFDGLRIARVAGHAINARGGCQGIRILGCEISDCGAGGIYVGGEGALIENNLVQGVGLSYPSAIGIFRGGRGNRVSHNEVHNCSYSAINYGGTDNIVEHNLNYDCMKTLHDGAAIYMFAATNCILRGNVARDFHDTGGYGASAYYLDERSWHCLVESNLSIRVNWPTHNHMAKNNVIRQNVFLVEGDAKLTFPRSAGYLFEKNILSAVGKIRIEGVNAVTNWSRNLFFSGAGKIERVFLNQYSATGQENGPPGDTVAQEPGFRDAPKGDYRFNVDSPAPAMGIMPIDVSTAGRFRRK